MLPSKHNRLSRQLLLLLVRVLLLASTCSSFKWRSTTGGTISFLERQYASLKFRAARDREIKVRTLEEAARQAGQR